MRYGILIPPFGLCADLTMLTSLAVDAEKAGWEGFLL
jgi:hypothetical protein